MPLQELADGFVIQVGPLDEDFYRLDLALDFRDGDVHQMHVWQFIQALGKLYGAGVDGFHDIQYKQFHFYHGISLFVGAASQPSTMHRHMFISYFKVSNLNLFMNFDGKITAAAILAVLVLALALGILWLISANQLHPTKTATLRMPDGTIVAAEVADTPALREKGLMLRESLCEACGMLFVFQEPARHPFWMKNTLIPLELIYMNESFGVVEIAQLQPCKNDPCNSYLPVQAATYVLEVNEGFAGRHNISVGSKLLS
ncbi:hypothetical protein COX84_00545 [Candidatus Micrarchaeota archaeon CG_4_10_14_0_2_um_filter_49_7]|nr:MAG: hypothetical protein COX84_00545 [Candidatus Micrarchaeota archaeon CG_4_10_14_0_2_um_filter_49_7]